MSKNKIWVCVACGKTSEDKYGTVNTSYGWDISCCLNAQEFDKDDLVYSKGKRVIQVKEENENI